MRPTGHHSVCFNRNKQDEMEEEEEEEGAVCVIKVGEKLMELNGNKLDFYLAGERRRS